MATMPETLRRICDGERTDLTPEQIAAYEPICARYRTSGRPSGGATISAVSWNGTPATGTPVVVVHRPPVEIPGPGTELKKLFDSIGVSVHGVQTNGCGSCQELMNTMNSLGVDGCRRETDSLLAELRERLKLLKEEKRVTLLGTLYAGVSAALQGMVLNPIDPFPQLLTEAIRRAEVAAIKLPIVQLPAPKPPTWAYGITTTPARRHSLLPKTLESLAAAGFDSPSLFVDGCADAKLYAEFGDVTCRNPPIGRYANWFLSALSLYQRNPSAEWYALFHDDIELDEGARAYLERTATDEKSFYNLYRSHREPPDAIGWWKPEQRKYEWGQLAEALVFPHKAFRTLIGSPGMRDDLMLVCAMELTGITEQIHNPRLARRIEAVELVDAGGLLP